MTTTFGEGILSLSAIWECRILAKWTEVKIHPKHDWKLKGMNEANPLRKGTCCVIEFRIRLLLPALANQYFGPVKQSIFDRQYSRRQRYSFDSCLWQIMINCFICISVFISLSLCIMVNIFCSHSHAYQYWIRLKFEIKGTSTHAQYRLPLYLSLPKQQMIWNLIWLWVKNGRKFRISNFNELCLIDFNSSFILMQKYPVNDVCVCLWNENCNFSCPQSRMIDVWVFRDMSMSMSDPFIYSLSNFTFVECVEHRTLNIYELDSIMGFVVVVRKLESLLFTWLNL